MNLALCSLVLLLAFPQCVFTQGDIPAGVPPEWLQPIGGGTAAPTTNNPTPATNNPAPANNNPTPTNNNPAPANNNPTPSPNPTTPATDPNAATAAPVSPTPNPAATAAPTTPATDPNAAATTPATPAVDPTATAAPAVNPTDPNAAALNPNATAAPVNPFDPNAAATAPATGALVGATAPAPAQQVVVPEATQVEEPPAKEPVPDNLPPAPPADWKALPVDTEIIFGLQLDGPYLAPWTKSKSWVFTNVLADRYLRSVDKEDIETGPLETKQYNVPAAQEDGSRRRLFGTRRHLQQESASNVGSTVVLRVKVHTNYLRVESEVRTVVDGISSGTLAQDLTMSLGAPVSNVSLTAQPITQPYNFNEDPNANSGGSLPGWIIGCIVGAILVVMPIPAYVLYKRHKRKHLETVEKQQAEAAAARQRMQSRIIKSGGKSFSAPRSDALEHDIYARSGSIASYGGYTHVYPPGPESVVEGRIDSATMLRSASFVGPPRSPTRMPSMQQQRYQEQSLGPGGAPNRAPSYTNMQQMNFSRGAVLPMRGSDEASTSSGSERRAMY